MRVPGRISTSHHVDRLVVGAAHRLLCGARAVGTRLLAWQQLARERRALLEIDGRMLRDIGLRREDVIREARRPFWDDDRVDWWFRR